MENINDLYNQNGLKKVINLFGLDIADLSLEKIQENFKVHKLGFLSPGVMSNALIDWMDFIPITSVVALKKIRGDQKKI